MGLLDDGINEIIATTGGNAAPVGLICRNGTFRMHLFRGSHTATNIAKNGWVVANILYDPVMFVRTAFDDLPEYFFQDESIGNLRMQRLRETDAWVAFTAEIGKETPEALMVRLNPVREMILHSSLRPVNRGFNSVIEVAVHGTRYLRNRDPELEKLILHHARLIRKCGGPKESGALDLLRRYLDLDI
ncbi:MAG: DUF447 domain-containing protein [Methanoregulaceae archaeon]